MSYERCGAAVIGGVRLSRSFASNSPIPSVDFPTRTSVPLSMSVRYRFIVCDFSDACLDDNINFSEIGSGSSYLILTAFIESAYLSPGLSISFLALSGKILTTDFSPSTPIFLSIIASAPHAISWHDDSIAATLLEFGIWMPLSAGFFVSWAWRVPSGLQVQSPWAPEKLRSTYSQRVYRIFPSRVMDGVPSNSIELPICVILAPSGDIL